MRQREKFYINLLQEIQPPKVRRADIDKWYAIKRKTGVDIDKKLTFTKIEQPVKGNHYSVVLYSGRNL